MMQFEITDTAILTFGILWASMFLTLMWYLIRKDLNDDLNDADSPKSKRWWSDE